MLKRSTICLLLVGVIAVGAVGLWLSQPSSRKPVLQSSSDSESGAQHEATFRQASPVPEPGKKTSRVVSPVRPERHVADEQPRNADLRREQRNEVAAAQGGGDHDSESVAAPPKLRHAQRRSGSPHTRAASDGQETASRKQEPVATGLPGTGSRPMPSRSARGSAWAGAHVTQQSVQGSTVESKGNQAADPAENRSLDVQASDQQAVAVNAVPTDASESENQSDPTDPEPVATPLDVVQVAKQWQADTLQVSYAVLLDQDSETQTPNGLIVSQEIPVGWEVVEAEPLAEMVDQDSRVIKWLFVGDAVKDNSIYTLSMRAPAEQAGDWNETLAWYTYRQPDGQCVDVEVIPYPESDIQPGN
jgi:hypothetical protein